MVKTRKSSDRDEGETKKAASESLQKGIENPLRST